MSVHINRDPETGQMRVSLPREDCRKAVLEAVKHLLNSVKAFEEASTILEHCANECENSHCELSEFLQERSMPQNHTPLFQATLQANDKDTLKILLHLINLSAPLTRETLFDIRHACIIRDDNFLYQKLRRMVKYEDGWLSDVEKTYFSMKARDEIEVTTKRQDSVEFIASFKIPAFQTRMRGLGEVILDFIAQGRMWRLRFSATVDHPPSLRFPFFHRQKPLVTPNTLQVTLSLMEHSDSTPLQGVLEIPSVPVSFQVIRRDISTESQSQLVSPPTHKQKQKKHTQSEIKTTLDSVASGSVYIAEDGSLSGTLDASLSMAKSKAITTLNLYKVMRYVNK